MLKRVMVSLCVFLILICATLYLIQDVLLFPVLLAKIAGVSADDPPSYIDTFTVTTPDGAELDVWTTHGKVAGLDSPYVGMIFHGNGETASMMNYLPFFMRHKIPAFTFDYRGYGRSSGWPSEKRILDDSELVWEAIKKRTGKDAAHLVILGNSIGSAPATHLAAKVSPRALILIAGFASLSETLKDIPQYRYLTWLLRYRFNNSENLAKVKTECLILAHGKRDTVINFRHQALLQKSVGNEMIKAITVLQNEEAGHNDIYYAVEDQLNATLSNCLGTKYEFTPWPPQPQRSDNP